MYTPCCDKLIDQRLTPELTSFQCPLCGTRYRISSVRGKHNSGDKVTYHFTNVSNLFGKVEVATDG